MHSVVLKKRISDSKGFTVLETLVAITILILAVTGTFTAAQTALSQAIFAKEQVVSFFLAQEAVEYIRNLRDSNALSGSNWLTGLASQSSDPCYFGKTCRVDATLGANAFTACSGGAGSCPILLQNTSGNFLYGYTTGWANSPFKREIQLQQINSNEVLATVTVTFSKGLTSKTVTVTESIFNWQ